MNRLAWIILVLQAAVLPQQTAKLEVEEQRDIYSIYSAMITSPMTRLDSNEAIYLIQESTIKDSGAPTCVKTPPGDAAAMAEITAEYNRRGNDSSVLTREFKLPKPYELLDRDKSARFLQDALDATPQILPPGASRPVNPNPLFPQAEQVFRFSDVYFDKTHTFALAWVAIYSTTVEYRGTWRPYKKTASGMWEENRTWTACGRSRSA